MKPKSDVPNAPVDVDIRRRAFMGTVAVGGVTAGLGLPVAHAKSAPATQSALASQLTSDVSFKVNGTNHQLRLDPRVTLLDALREHLGLTGVKKGCDRGQCGACTVIVSGRRINSCLTLAVMHAGDTITTVEGLAVLGKPSALQAAFLEHDAFQCGYCTPGQLCSATALLNEVKAGQVSAATSDMSAALIDLTDAEIRERMSGNICRCGAYPNIVAALRAVADEH
jgi:xanthine dehydrogenase YagT iron-sulfur-binding subunit